MQAIIAILNHWFDKDELSCPYAIDLVVERIDLEDLFPNVLAIKDVAIIDVMDEQKREELDVVVPNKRIAFVTNKGVVNPINMHLAIGDVYAVEKVLEDDESN